MVGVKEEIAIEIEIKIEVVVTELLEEKKIKIIIDTKIYKSRLLMLLCKK